MKLIKPLYGITILLYIIGHIIKVCQTNRKRFPKIRPNGRTCESECRKNLVNINENKITCNELAKNTAVVLVSHRRAFM